MRRTTGTSTASAGRTRASSSRAVSARTAKRQRSPWASHRATSAAAARWATIIGAWADRSAIRWWMGSVGVVAGWRAGADEGVLERADPVPVDDRQLGETGVAGRVAAGAFGSPTVAGGQGQAEVDERLAADHQPEQPQPRGGPRQHRQLSEHDEHVEDRPGTPCPGSRPSAMTWPAVPRKNANEPGEERAHPQHRGRDAGLHDASVAQLGDPQCLDYGALRTRTAPRPASPSRSRRRPARCRRPTSPRRPGPCHRRGPEQVPVGRPADVVPRVGVLEGGAGRDVVDDALRGLVGSPSRRWGSCASGGRRGRRTRTSPSACVTSPTRASSAIERISQTFPRCTA